jgi:hypothetical protein
MTRKYSIRKYSIQTTALQIGSFSLWMPKTRRVIGAAVVMDSPNSSDLRSEALPFESSVELSVKDSNSFMKPVPSLAIITVENTEDLSEISSNRDFYVAMDNEWIDSCWVLVGIVTHNRDVYYVLEKINEASVGL